MIKKGIQNIKRIDIFGAIPTLTLNKKARHQTIFGGILTAICMSLIATSSFLIGREVFERTNPTVVYESKRHSFRPSIKLDKNKFAFAFTVSDAFQSFFDFKEMERYFQAEPIILASKVTNGKGERLFRKPIKFARCTKEDFPNHGIFFEETLLPNYYCLKEPFEIKGFWNSDNIEIYALSINILRCDEERQPGVECASDDEMKEWIKGKYYYIYYQDDSQTFSNNARPYERFLNTYYENMKFTEHLKVFFI